MLCLTSDSLVNLTYLYGFIHYHAALAVFLRIISLYNVLWHLYGIYRELNQSSKACFSTNSVTVMAWGWLNIFIDWIHLQATKPYWHLWIWTCLFLPTIHWCATSATAVLWPHLTVQSQSFGLYLKAPLNLARSR